MIAPTHVSFFKKKQDEILEGEHIEYLLNQLIEAKF